MLMAFEEFDGDSEPGGFDRAELANLLDSIENDGWVVEQTVSRSPYEVTQIVHREKSLVEGMFVRKVFTGDVGLGTAYQRLLGAQLSGKRFEHLPLVYDMVESDDGVVVISEFVQGKTLRRFVQDNGPSPQTAAFAAKGLCDAMVELHEGLGSPVVHRDLKPSNIMVSNGVVKIIDLGIARAWRPGGEHDTVRFGTPGYAPPEQFGYGQTTPQSDIYAAGMVMAFCLTGEDPTPRLRESGFEDGRIPEEFRALLARATALDASARFADARDMKEAVVDAFVQWERNATRMHASSGSQLRQDQPQPRPQPQVQPRIQPQPQPQPQSAAQPWGPEGGRGPQPDLQDQPRFRLQNDSQPQSRFQAGSQQQQRRPSTSKLSSIPEGLGKAWNILLLVAWGFLTFLSLMAAFAGDTEFLRQMPVGLRVFSYLGVVIIPSGATAYLIADKRRLRRRFPALDRLRGVRLGAACIGLSAASFAIALVAYTAFISNA